MSAGGSGIAVSCEDHVGLVVIDKPPNNHVSVELVRGIADALDALDADDACRAVVLASQGRVFCGGADLSGPAGLERAEGSTVNPLYDQAVRLFATRKPIVVAVQGAAIGAGLGLTLVADYRIAAEEARFSANFVKLGFHAGFGISHTLPRIVGLQRAALMLQTGRRIKAEEALRWGLADDVVAAGELRGRALGLARELAENAPLAVQSTRATLRKGLYQAVRETMVHELAEQTRLMRTEDFREGLRSVAARRPGRFEGR